MHIYLDPNVEVAESALQYAQDNCIDTEGEVFQVLVVDVIGANTYKIENGKPMLVAIAQPNGVVDRG
jgi:hypothetical protein